MTKIDSVGKRYPQKGVYYDATITGCKFMDKIFDVLLCFESSNNN